MDGLDSSSDIFISNYIISNWDTKIGIDGQSWGTLLIGIFWFAMGARLAYIIFIKKKSSRYVNTELLYLFLINVNLAFSIMLRFTPFVIICAILTAFVILMIDGIYADIDRDESKGLNAYLPWVREKEEKEAAALTGHLGDGRPSNTTEKIGDFHYKVNKTLLFVFACVPSLLMFFTLNTLLPLFH